MFRIVGLTRAGLALVALVTLTGVTMITGPAHAWFIARRSACREVASCVRLSGRRLPALLSIARRSVCQKAA
jgi:hypothetical protein